MIEIARNVLGYRDADHSESNPDATRPVVRALTCSLAGQQLEMDLTPSSGAARAYGTVTAVEDYFCGYGIDPAYWSELLQAGVVVTGRDRVDGDPRIIELAGHPYFVATLFVPQVRSTPSNPHPLVVAHLRAAQALSDSRR